MEPQTQPINAHHNQMKTELNLSHGCHSIHAHMHLHLTVSIHSTRNVIEIYIHIYISETLCCGRAGTMGTCSVRAEDSCAFLVTHPEGVMEGE